MAETEVVLDSQGRGCGSGSLGGDVVFVSSWVLFKEAGWW